MAYKTRVNPKTGKTEYKVRYYFKVSDRPKPRDSETGWFTSLEKAEKEAERLKAKKEKEDRQNAIKRRDKRLSVAYEEYKNYIKELADKEISNTYKKEYKLCKTMLKKHMPQDVFDTKIKDISTYTWRSWLSYINAKEKVGGAYIRQCRLNLIKFNTWLNQNGYYIDDDEEDNYDIAIKRVKIKNSKVNNRERSGERNVVSILDFMNITRYYIKKENGLGEFRNFYYYTLFFVLFFSGMRVEELTGLQWKFIDLRESHRTISIRNAISVVESLEHALERVKKGDNRTKNATSVRTIPIFDFYYELLKDYKECFRYEYGVDKQEIEECFVFPNLRCNDPHRYMYSKATLCELKRVIKVLDIPNTDLQMFRHSCATFLILPLPNGLGYTEEMVKDYFGHQDTSMLTSVYARLNQIQKTERMSSVFSDIYKPNATDEKTKEEQMKQELINRIVGDNERQKSYAKEKRIHSQIDVNINKGKKEYYYLSKDKGIIDKYIKEKGCAIDFIEVEE